jgi:hypothetical protein
MTTSLRLRLAATLVGITSLAATAAFLSPARAADTTTTFTLTGGALAITSPANASLGSVATGTATTSAQLGVVAVTDSRGALLGQWTAAVTSSDFITGGATANETIAKASADYWSGPATVSSGVGVFTPGQLAALNKVALDVSRTAFSATAVVGNNTRSWNPTVIINVPAAAVAGAYTGTITHSFA